MNVIPETVTQVIVGNSECDHNSGDHKASIMSIPDECYSRNGYQVIVVIITLQ